MLNIAMNQQRSNFTQFCHRVFPGSCLCSPFLRPVTGSIEIPAKDLTNVGKWIGLVTVPTRLLLRVASVKGHQLIYRCSSCLDVSAVSWSGEQLFITGTPAALWLKYSSVGAQTGVEAFPDATCHWTWWMLLTDSWLIFQNDLKYKWNVTFSGVFFFFYLWSLKWTKMPKMNTGCPIFNKRVQTWPPGRPHFNGLINGNMAPSTLGEGAVRSSAVAAHQRL